MTLSWVLVSLWAAAGVAFADPPTAKDAAEAAAAVRAAMERMTDAAGATCESPQPAPAAPPKPAAIYSAAVPFDIGTEGLCFENDGKIWSETWHLKKIAQKWGACQGMVWVAAAFKARARFNCSGKKLTKEQVRTRMGRILDFQAAGCEEDRVEFTGYCSLRDLCAAHSAVLENASVDENAERFFDKVLEHVLELNKGRTASAQERNMGAISELYHELDEGRTPALLYPWHVVMVTGIEIRRTVDAYEAILTTYDPNDNASPTLRVIAIAKDFKRTVNEDPLFALEIGRSFELPVCDDYRRDREPRFAPF